MMKRIWKPFVLVVVFGILAAYLYLDIYANADYQVGTPLEAAFDPPVGSAVGQLAPDFEGATLSGETIRLSDLRGKTVLVNVFASWCGPCRLETPHLVEAFDALSEDDVVFIGINLGEAPGAVASFQGEFGINYPLVLNQSGDLTRGGLYRPIGLPTSWFIDQEGVVRFVFSGAMTQDMLLQIIDDVKAGREPAPFAT